MVADMRTTTTHWQRRAHRAVGLFILRTQTIEWTKWKQTTVTQNGGDKKYFYFLLLFFIRNFLAKRVRISDDIIICLMNDWLLLYTINWCVCCFIGIEAQMVFYSSGDCCCWFFFSFFFSNVALLSQIYHRDFFFDFNSISVWFGILFGQAYKTFHCTNRCWWWWFMESIDYEICCPLLDLLISAIWYFDEANPVQDCIFLYENGRMSGWMLL